MLLFLYFIVTGTNFLLKFLTIIGLPYISTDKTNRIYRLTPCTRARHFWSHTGEGAQTQETWHKTTHGFKLIFHSSMQLNVTWLQAKPPNALAPSESSKADMLLQKNIPFPALTRICHHWTKCPGRAMLGIVLPRLINTWNIRYIVIFIKFPETTNKSSALTWTQHNNKIK